MKFDDFIKNYHEKPLIDSSTFVLLDAKPQDIRRQVSCWVEKGYLLALKKGIYIFNDNYRKIAPSKRFIANFLVSPSYLSLEYALGYYGLIPEKVAVYTSITTKKTETYRNCLGTFEYRSVKEDIFFGFTKATDSGQDFFIAQPEKALLDFFYFHKSLQGKPAEFESLRLQNLDTLDMGKMSDLGEKFTEKVNRVTKAFIDFALQETKEYRELT